MDTEPEISAYFIGTDEWVLTQWKQSLKNDGRSRWMLFPERKIWSRIDLKFNSLDQSFAAVNALQSRLDTELENFSSIHPPSFVILRLPGCELNTADLLSIQAISVALKSLVLQYRLTQPFKVREESIAGFMPIIAIVEPQLIDGAMLLKSFGIDVTLSRFAAIEPVLGQLSKSVTRYAPMRHPWMQSD